MSTETSGSGTSRRSLWIAALVISIVAIVVAFTANNGIHSDAPKTAPTSAPAATATTPTTWSAPAGLAGLARGRYIAVVNGTIVVVRANGSVHRLLQEITRSTQVLASARNAFLVGTTPWEAMIATPAAARFGEVLPSGVTLIPDALGRWWSDFGQVGGKSALQHLTFPAQARPVAKLADGYLLVDAANTALLVRRDNGTTTRIGAGPARVLAVQNDLVAWSNAVDGVVHVTNLTTNRTIDIHAAGSSATARFSPDGTRVAILTLTDGQSTVLADATSGRVLKQITSATANASLHQLRNAPPALQPSPFSWDRATGNLIVVATAGANGPEVLSVDVNGKVQHTAPAPAGLSQLVPL